MFMHMAAINNKRKKQRSIIYSNIKRLPVALLVLLIVFSAINCAPQKRYKVLKFFFDGVPEPGAAKRKAEEERRKKAAKTKPGQPTKQPEQWQAIKSRHPDYFRNICNNCHDNTAGNFMRTARKEDLCFTCHKQEQFTGAFVHGPVAVQNCLTCHLPHESPLPNLLKKKTPELCTQCHEQPSFSAAETCKRDMDCSQCHYPHASPKRYFLK